MGFVYEVVGLLVVKPVEGYCGREVNSVAPGYPVPGNMPFSSSGLGTGVVNMGLSLNGGWGLVPGYGYPVKTWSDSVGIWVGVWNGLGLWVLLGGR